jgi:hypothetical protein
MGVGVDMGMGPDKAGPDADEFGIGPGAVGAFGTGPFGIGPVGAFGIGPDAVGPDPAFCSFGGTSNPSNNPLNIPANARPPNNTSTKKPKPCDIFNFLKFLPNLFNIIFYIYTFKKSVAKYTQPFIREASKKRLIFFFCFIYKNVRKGNQQSFRTFRQKILYVFLHSLSDGICLLNL